MAWYATLLIVLGVLCFGDDEVLLGSYALALACYFPMSFVWLFVGPRISRNPAGTDDDLEINPRLVSFVALLASAYMSVSTFYKEDTVLSVVSGIVALWCAESCFRKGRKAAAPKRAGVRDEKLKINESRPL